MTVPAPSIEYSQLAPMLIVFGTAVAGVLVEAFMPRRGRYAGQLALSLAGLAASFVAVVALHGSRHIAVVGAVAVDGPALFLQGTILLIAMLSILLIAERRTVPAFAAQAAALPGSAAETTADRAGAEHTEVFPLTLFAVGGMLLFPAANDLLTMFIALEVLSLPLYLLCGLARRKRQLSHEAALKYFLLGAFSSALFLYGVALLYGYTGTVRLSGIGEVIGDHHGSDPIAVIGIALVCVGLLFKVGAVPFHSWVPDVYQGAPTPVTAFMASATKVAAFGALLRICYVAINSVRWDWRPVLWAAAVLTMAIGAILAVTQTDVKRMLAYSSITHAGFMLTGLVAANPDGLSSTMFYLLAYGFSTLGAFAIVALIRAADGDEATDLAGWAGLGQRSPLLAGVFALFLLAFAGIPLTSGFVSKFAVFQAAVAGGAWPLVVVGVVSSAIAAFFYVRVIVNMFFSPPPAEAPVITTPSVLTTTTIAIGAVVTVVLGIYPQPILDLATHAGTFL